MKALDRRKFIKLGSTGSAVLLSWPFLNACEGLSSKKNESADPDFEPDLDIDLTAKESQIPLFQGSSTKVWMFETKINTGADDAIQQLNDIYLGPILRVRKGQKVRIRFKNKLPEKVLCTGTGCTCRKNMTAIPKML